MESRYKQNMGVGLLERVKSTKTIQDKMTVAKGRTIGFDYLRISLALAVMVWHSYRISGATIAADAAVWSGPFRFLLAAILPMFFSLSGFLVAGSLERTRLHQFVTLRVVRLVPALAVEITLSAVILGILFTDLPRMQYLMDRTFYTYFLNIVGRIHYTLPGVFGANPLPWIVNAQLWTIPFELECYVGLILLSVATLLKHRRALTVVVIALSLAFTVWTIYDPVDPTVHLPGRVLVLSFLAAVTIYLRRDIMPYSTPLGLGSAVLMALLLQIPNGAFLAAFPAAYLTVWLGLMSPPAILFGDLSYGVYLFHFPVEQALMHVFPGIHSWWLLMLVALPLTGFFAWLSWNLIEAPLLARKKLILATADRVQASVMNRMRLGR